MAGIALVLLAPVATTRPAAAADPIRLRVADSFPADHFLVRIMLRPWMEEVTKRTGGAVVFQHYPNQQLGKASDLLRLTQTGVVDIGYVAPSYASDKMPMSEVAQLPGEFDTVCPGTMAYWKSARSGELQKADYAPNKLHLLLTTVLPPYRTFTTRTTINGLDDFSGLKLRTAGGAQDLTARALGAVPVRMAAPDAYESLSRGTMDGLLFPTESVISYGLDKLVRHATDGVGFGSFVIAYSISMDNWKRLPEKVRTAMDQVADELEPQICKKVQDEEAVSRKKMEAGGVVFTALSPAAVKAIHGKLTGVAQEWAKGLDARGKPGTTVLNDFEAQLHKAGG